MGLQETAQKMNLSVTNQTETDISFSK